MSSGQQTYSERTNRDMSRGGALLAAAEKKKKEKWLHDVVGNETAHAGGSACSRPALQLDRQQRSNFFGEASTLNTILSILPAMFSVCHCPVLQMPLQACPSKP